jgi:hypothetical protein
MSHDHTLSCLYDANGRLACKYEPDSPQGRPERRSPKHLAEAVAREHERIAHVEPRRTTQAIERLEGRASNVANLLRALGGSPEGWEWTGEMHEQDPGAPGSIPCACGHRPIRWLFPWKKTMPDGSTRQITTGSVCVERVPGLDPKSLEGIKLTIDKLETQKREKAARLRASMLDEEAKTLHGKLFAAIEARYGHAARRRSEGGWLPEGVYEEAREYESWKKLARKALALKQPGSRKKRLRELIRDWNRRVVGEVRTTAYVDVEPEAEDIAYAALVSEARPIADDLARTSVPPPQLLEEKEDQYGRKRYRYGAGGASMVTWEKEPPRHSEWKRTYLEHEATARAGGRRAVVDHVMRILSRMGAI